MQLSDLKANLVRLANRRDLTADTALQQTFIDQAITRIQRELKCPAMEKGVDVTIADPYAGLVIPDDFLELKEIIPVSATGADELTVDKLSNVRRKALNVGVPETYCRQGGVWILGPAPAVGDVIHVDYYAELSPLVNPTDENIISIIGWDLIVYAALVAAAIHYTDDRKDQWDTEYNRILNGLQDQSDEDELFDAQVAPAYEWPCDN